MPTLFGGNVHAGLSGLEFEEETFDLGEGVILTKTYAHLMAPFLMAFKPAPPGGHHPVPWKAASGGFSFDLNAELLIPENIEAKFVSKIAVARTIVFLLRLRVHPGITLPVFSNHRFASLAEVRDNEATLVPFEVQPRHFPLEPDDGIRITEAISWVKERWQVTHRLISASPEFSLAVGAIDAGQFVQNTTLTMVSLWGALETLFSPSTSELNFRVSSLVAAFLEPPGEARHNLQKKITRLYDKRSAAAHGKPKHKAEDLTDTFNLLACVLMQIIDRGNVPKKEELEGLLFGSTLKANS